MRKKSENIFADDDESKINNEGDFDISKNVEKSSNGLTVSVKHQKAWALSKSYDNTRISNLENGMNRYLSELHRGEKVKEVSKEYFETMKIIINLVDRKRTVESLRLKEILSIYNTIEN